MTRQMKSYNRKKKTRYGVGRKSLRKETENDLNSVPEKVSLFGRIFSFFCCLFTFLFHPRENKSNITISDKASKILAERIQALESKMLKFTIEMKQLQKQQLKNPPVTTTIPPPPPILQNLPPPAPMIAKQTVKTPRVVARKRVGFTMQDLQRVKLKKPDSKPEKDTNKTSTKVQLVTLKDLQNVKLKKSSASLQNKANQNSNSPKLTKALRRTNVIRSPGGTPMIKRNKEHSTATGLTPAFTKALRKKFQSFERSPASKESSPGCWRC